MSNSINVAHVELGAHLTTSISDDGWETVGPDHIACWKSAQCLLNRWSFEHEGSRVDLEVDWVPVIRRLQNTHRLMRKLESIKGTSPSYSSHSRDSLAGML